MKLVPVVRTVGVVTQTSTVSETEALTSLLPDRNTGLRISGTITLSESRRIGERLNGATELLSRDQVQVLDVVCVLGRSLSTRRGLGNGRKTVPGVARVVDAIGRDVQDTLINTGLKQALAHVIPSENCHFDSFQK